MSQWDDKYKEHPVHATLSSLCDIIESEALISEDVTIIGVVDRIRQAAEYTTTSLQNIIPAIFNNGVLNNINSYLQSIINEVNSYISNKNIGHLNNVVGYLRPEIAQGIFLNFKNIFRLYGLKLPIGIGQIGKAFRNEISPRNILIRMREFSQMELEYFFDPEEDELKINNNIITNDFLSQKINLLTVKNI